MADISPAPLGAEAALPIYQSVLDTLSQNLLRGEFDALPDFYNLPTQVRTVRAEMVFETAEDVVENYRGFHEEQTSLGMTDLMWLASEARWLNRDYIEGFHATHILSGTRSLHPPYQNRMVLREVDGRWRIDELETSLSNTHWPFDKLLIKEGAPGVDPSRLAWNAHDARTVVSDPLAIYQQFLEDYSACNMADDFDGWAAMHLFPHTVHTEVMDRTIKAPEGLRDFFDMLSRIIRENGANRFDRAPSRAEFLSSNKICGYHIGSITRGDEIILGPIKSRMILQRVGPKWFLRSVTNSIANDAFPYKKPIVSAELIGLRQIQARKTP